MLDPTAGSVIIDGVDARDVSLSSLRERIAVVCVYVYVSLCLHVYVYYVSMSPYMSMCLYVSMYMCIMSLCKWMDEKCYV